MSSLKEQFDRDGFVILPAVYSSGEQAALREASTRIFASAPTFPGDRTNIRFDWIARHPELRRIALNEKFVRCMKEVAGRDFLVMPDSAFMDSCYGGWHRDTGPQEKYGNLFHYEPGFLLINVALYLQDNHELYAGGLDIVPGSHKTQATWWQKQKSSNSKVKFVFHHLIKRKILSDDFVHRRKGAYSIPSRAGDVVLFHHQCDHRATQLKASAVPELRRKLALFFSCSANNHLARSYVDHCRGRSDTIYLKDYAYPPGFFEDIGSALPENFYRDDLIVVK